MITFGVLVLILLAINAAMLAARRYGEHARPWRSTRYAANFFRPSGNPAWPAASSDRDAERQFADVLAMSRRAPHN